jgi:signal transduction histidine kinase
LNKDKPIALLLAFRAAVTLLIAYAIWTHPGLSDGARTAFTAGILALQANDLWRNYYRLVQRSKLLYYSSIIASIAGTGIYLVQFDHLAVNIYFVFPVVEMLMAGSAIPYGLLAVHVLVALMTMYALKAAPQNALFSYLAMLFLVFLFRAHSLERKKGQLLSAELTEAQAQLKEAAVVKERTRIAQELHDSIGHSLVALRMHLEFAENAADTQPERSKEVIAKALAISRQSLTDLRKAVAVLKDTGSPNGLKLRESLDEMIRSVQTGALTFQFDFEPSVEFARADIKTSI